VQCRPRQQVAGCQLETAEQVAPARGEARREPCPHASATGAACSPAANAVAPGTRDADLVLLEQAPDPRWSSRPKSLRAASGPEAPPARPTVTTSWSPTRPTFIGPSTRAASPTSSGCSVLRRRPMVSQSIGSRRSERRPLIHQLHGGQHK
jgi:hypothetical protein